VKKFTLADDRWCFACGTNNPAGLKLVFSLDGSKVLRTSFTFRKEHQGYKDIVHGGFISLILDEVMLNLAWRLGIHAVTAELNIRFRKPVSVGDRVDFEGRITASNGRLLEAEAEARDAAGEIVAAATAKCVALKK